jgi:transcriptional antiterminator RfaH
MATWKTTAVCPTISQASHSGPSARPAWYCIYSRQKREHFAAANLSRFLGLEVFNPSLLVKRPTLRRVVRVKEPLFPSYLFARFLLHTQLDRVRFTPGVRTVIRCGPRWACIPDVVIEELQERFGPSQCIECRTGPAPREEVRIVNGPALGLTGLVERYMPAHQRVWILIDFLNRLVPLEVGIESVAFNNHYPETLLA